jgi:hypothetical protein
VLWFYEEQCPKCRAKWPSMYEAARKFEGRPIVFIAVNSGNPRAAVEQYAREVDLKWPVIVDADRSLEAAAGVGQISLQNIYQMRLILPNGSITNGDWNNIEGSAERALKGAKWKIDPTGLSPQLKPAWMALELGDTPGASQMLKKLRPSAKGDVKESLAKLDAAVASEIESLVAEGKAAMTSGNKLAAYKACDQLLERYGGFALPAGLEEKRKDLAADPGVKAALAAAGMLANAKKQLASGSPLGKKRVAAILERIIKDSPESDAGLEAKELLAQLKG